MIFAETERLYLRALTYPELPRMTDLLNDWDVVRWLAVVPFPYTMKDAGDFYTDMAACYARGAPELFILAQKTDDLLIGAVGLHPPRDVNPEPGEVEIGYWLARDYWGQGFMSEAAREALKIAFARPATRLVGATTALDNDASQNVLRKIGLRNMGEVPRDYGALRGDDTVLKWRITRDDYEKESAA
ncbi:MAG: GNAT family N-acetyltransferase [Alphaproteobacteria bacterium]|nr:GNAT family N-acetyltransferase [Alphaproteobacteria bacterium]